MTKENLVDLYYPWSVTTRVLKSQLEGLSQEQSLQNPPNGGNPINWLAGHLVLSRTMIIKMLGSKFVLDESYRNAYGRGTGMREDNSLALPVDKLLEDWMASKDQLKSSIIDLDPAHLEIKQPNGKTMLAMLQFYQFHESYHAGQVGYARRILGLDGLIA